jgi:hypothetical protein
MTWRIEKAICSKKLWMESLGSIESQIVGRSVCSAHSETKEVFPYPAGATTTVTPGTFFSKRLNRCGLEMKLAGRLGLRLLEILGSDGADSTIFMGLFSAEKELKFN